MNFTLAALSEILDTPVRGGTPETTITHYEIDSRRVDSTGLFFALKGEHLDGHDYVKSVQKAGGVAVVEREVPLCGSGGVLQVPCVEEALLTLGRAVRRHLSPSRLVAVTGSCGKTSTKEFLRAALAPQGTVGATSGNKNNHLGVPLTLLGFTLEERSHVLELGMNHFQEIDLLAGVVQPKVGVITSICPVHLEGVGSLEGVRKAKGELLAHILPQGTAVLPATEPLLVEQARALGRGVVTFGPGGEYEVEALESGLFGATFTLRTPQGRFPVEIPVGGAHQANNSAAAIATAVVLGDPIKEAIAGVGGATLPGGRARRMEKPTCTVFNDAYNASPKSMEAVLEMVAAGPPPSTVHLLLGEMRELGDRAPEYHRELGALAGTLGCATLFYVGGYAQEFREGVACAGGQCTTFPTPQKAGQALRARLTSPEELLVVKGSRGVRLELALEEL